MKVFFLFLDGVGIGKKDPGVNPLFAARLPVFTRLFGGSLPYRTDSGGVRIGGGGFAADAILDMPGLPQSGTGQASILTGENAARIYGRHFGPFLPTSLRPLLVERGLFSRVVRAGKKVTLANAFPQRYFEYTESATRRLSAFTYGSIAAGIPLNTSRELARGESLSVDFMRDRWNAMGHPEVAKISVQTAGEQCAGIVEKHDLTVFDYWLTDNVGHAQDLSKAVTVFERLDEFLGACLARLDLRRTVVVSVSDHGNAEDMSVRTHTLNPALGFAVGGRIGNAARRIRSLTDVAPFILECLKIPFAGG